MKTAAKLLILGLLVGALAGTMGGARTNATGAPTNVGTIGGGS